MNILAQVGAALQLLFGTLADEAATVAGVIVRQRKFTALTLARTFILGFLHKPKATDEDLAQMAVQCGVDVTPQAIEQRHTPKLVTFFEQLFRRGIQIAVQAQQTLGTILERFTQVLVLDSTTITLPDRQQERFRGCGGSYGSGAAALKLQVELDLRSGALAHIEIEPGRRPDAATTRQQATYPAGSLRIADLGYFNLAVFAALLHQSVHFLSRLQFGTRVYPVLAPALALLDWLARQREPLVDHPVVVGVTEQLPCRLIAWRVPEEQANRRRQKVRAEIRRKNGGTPSAARLAWCDWSILVTSVPETLLAPKEAVLLYRARWQVELLFKRWKSQDLVAVLSGSTEVRQMVRVWARLLAALVQHWLLVSSVWGDPTRSWGKVCEALRSFVGRIAAALERLPELEQVLREVRRVAQQTCRRDPRRQPGTLEMLHEPSLLDFAFVAPEPLPTA